MQTTQQQTSAKPDLSGEGPLMGKQYAQSGLHTSYSSCINQGTTIYIRHRWVWATEKLLQAWLGLFGPSHGKLCGPDS